MEADYEVEALTLDQLPYLCLTHICQYLLPEELARFAAVCKIIHQAAMSESLWRRQCLIRWAFCDIQQIKSSSNRWYCYFTARRRVEHRMDTGRPTRDYRVKSLRGHKADITNIVCMGGASTNWEQLTTPLVVALSSDSIVNVWNTTEGKVVWSIGDISSVVGCDEWNAVAVGDVNGHVIIYSVFDWSISNQFDVGGSIVCMKIIKYKSAIIMATSCSHVTDDIGNSTGSVTLFNPLKPHSILSSPDVLFDLMFDGGQWLAGCSGNKYHIWDLSEVLAGGSCDPHVTVHAHSADASIWLRPGVLATASSHIQMGPIPFPQVRNRRLLYNHLWGGGDLEIWDVAKHVKESKNSSSLVYRVAHLYAPSSTIKLLDGSCNVLTIANDLLLAGSSTGQLRVYDPTTGKSLQQFHDHNGHITDIYADSYRVLTCSSDYSIRVYRWVASQGTGLRLESLYQLLGGSVALKTHNGFVKVLCSAATCVGVAGDIIKLYNFIHQLE